MKRDGWVRHGEGLACPYLRCPRDGCQGPLVWLDRDRHVGVERLNCANPQCGATIDEDEVTLTRNRMRKSPPDIVFTTTEMLTKSQ